ncbi:hypothetical protein Ahy_A01g002631 isoform A [Arachis hypogaea]|uniref:Uncharacterized protein n=1 Tax=Arachis hypogaea TaxID=3818 RepID=A0A445ER15_ARAHY|nr:hypothetical protein Ahy_A01g002631 isoform A [Arachis hypogaea]
MSRVNEQVNPGRTLKSLGFNTMKIVQIAKKFRKRVAPPEYFDVPWLNGPANTCQTIKRRKKKKRKKKKNEEEKKKEKEMEEENHTEMRPEKIHPMKKKEEARREIFRSRGEGEKPSKPIWGS